MKPFHDELREHVYDLLKGTVEQRFDKWYQEAHLTYSKLVNWVLHKPPRSLKLAPQQEPFVEDAKTELAQASLLDADNIHFCYKALLNRGGSSCSGKSSNERLELGSIIQVLVTPGTEGRKFIRSSTSGNPTFYTIGGFFQSTSGSTWALVKKCTLISPAHISQLPDTKRSPLIEVITPDFYASSSQCPHSYLQMTSGITKVGSIHNCERYGTCSFNATSKNVEHSTTTLQGGNFFLLVRSMGYPPRRS